MSLQVILDTNVIISALLFGGKPEKVYQKILGGQWTGYISKEIFEEIRDVLLRKKFGLSIEFIRLLEGELQSYFHWTEPTQKIKNICRDEEDHIILECALEANVDFIITGDQDLLSLKKYKHISILTPEEILKQKP